MDHPVRADIMGSLVNILTILHIISFPKFLNEVSKYYCETNIFDRHKTLHNVEILPDQIQSCFNAILTKLTIHLCIFGRIYVLSQYGKFTKYSSSCDCFDKRCGIFKLRNGTYYVFVALLMRTLILGSFPFLRSFRISIML